MRFIEHTRDRDAPLDKQDIKMNLPFGRMNESTYTQDIYEAFRAKTNNNRTRKHKTNAKQ